MSRICHNVWIYSIHWLYISIYGDFLTSLTAYYLCADITPVMLLYLFYVYTPAYHVMFHIVFIYRRSVFLQTVELLLGKESNVWAVELQSVEDRKFDNNHSFLASGCRTSGLLNFRPPHSAAPPNLISILLKLAQKFWYFWSWFIIYYYILIENKQVFNVYVFANCLKPYLWSRRLQQRWSDK